MHGSAKHGCNKVFCADSIKDPQTKSPAAKAINPKTHTDKPPKCTHMYIYTNIYTTRTHALGCPACQPAAVGLPRSRGWWRRGWRQRRQALSVQTRVHALLRHDISYDACVCIGYDRLWCARVCALVPTRGRHTSSGHQWCVEHALHCWRQQHTMTASHAYTANDHSNHTQPTLCGDR